MMTSTKVSFCFASRSELKLSFFCTLKVWFILGLQTIGTLTEIKL